MDDEFAQYFASYPSALANIEKALRATTKIELLERLALKVAFCAERKKLPLPAAKSGAVFRTMLTKLSLETFAVIGCMRNGSAVGAFHHVRGLIELRAAFHYIYGDATTTAHRVERFAEWQYVAPYIHFKKLKMRLANGQMTQDDFDIESAPAMPFVTGVDAARLDNWTKLYGIDVAAKPTKLKEWYHGSTIADLIRALDSTGTLSAHYAVACNATHVSPLGHRLAGDTLKLIGWDAENAQAVVDTAIVSHVALLLQMDKVLGDVLVPFVQPEWDAFMKRGP